MPSDSATIVGPRPAEPVIAFRTRSASDVATSSRTPSGPGQDPRALGRAALCRRRVGDRDALDAVLVGLGDRLLPARMSRDADQLKVFPRGLDHLERLHADRAGGAEHDHTLHGGEGTEARQ